MFITDAKVVLSSIYIACLISSIDSYKFNFLQSLLYNFASVFVFSNMLVSS